MKIDRLVAIRNMLTNNKKLSAKYLAEYFEVSERTIYRDIESLEMSGVPVVSFQGREGGFGILEDYKFEKDFFKAEEIWQIVKALDGIAFTDENLKFTIEKLKSKILKDDFDKVKVRDSVRINFKSFYSSEKLEERFKILKRAIEDRNVVSFEYRDASNNYSVREVEPLVLTYYSYTTYLTAYCKLRGDYRFFKLSRMKGLKLIDEKFNIEDREIPELFVSENNSRGYIDLKLLFCKSVVGTVEEYFEGDNIKYQNNGDILVETTFPVSDWIEKFILNFGDKVEVLEPYYFREIIKERVEKIYKKYF